MASLRRMPKGTWQAIVRRKDYAPQFRTFETRKDAKQWARHVESKMERAVFVDCGPSERVKLAALIDRYIIEVLPGKKSEESLTRCLEFTKAQIGHFTLAALQAKDIAAYRDSRIASGRAGVRVDYFMNRRRTKPRGAGSRETGVHSPETFAARHSRIFITIRQTVGEP